MIHANYETLFETGEGDRRWAIERDQDGNLYCSSNAETRERVTDMRHSHQAIPGLVHDLQSQGVSEDIINDYLLQAGF